MNEGNTGKLVFLKDRGKRPAIRLPRRRAESARRTITEANRPTERETLWLSRSHYAVAAWLIVSWLAVGTGLVESASAQAHDWMLSLLLADLLVGLLLVLGGYELGGETPNAGMFARFAAGALATSGLVRIGHAVRESFQRELAPLERLEVCAVVACLCVSVWTISHSLRLRAER